MTEDKKSKGGEAGRERGWKPEQSRLDAADVLNWDYLVRIAEYVEGRVNNPMQALKGLAYAFTSTADESVRNQLLIDLLRNATEHCSKEAAEEFVERLASLLQSDLKVASSIREGEWNTSQERLAGLLDPALSDPIRVRLIERIDQQLIGPALFFRLPGTLMLFFPHADRGC